MKTPMARLPNTRNQHSRVELIIHPARYVRSHRQPRDHANATKVILIPKDRWQEVQCVSGRCFASACRPPSFSNRSVELATSRILLAELPVKFSRLRAIDKIQPRENEN